MMNMQELVDKLTQVGLDLRKATRIESLSDEKLVDYNPASDIVNLFPTLLAASINDLNSLENSERKVEIFSTEIIDRLCEAAFKEKDGLEFEQHMLKTLKRIKKVYPDCYEKLTSKFFVNALLSYFVANKFGLRSCTEKVGGKGYFHYFALLDFLEDMEPETQAMIVKNLANNHLWDVTEDDLEEI
jgi:hypothetical protein